MGSGQGREEGHRQGGELHSGYGDRFGGFDVDSSKVFSLFSVPKQSMLSQFSNNVLQ